MRFDIAWRDVLHAVAMQFGANDYESVVAQTQSTWNGGEQWMAALSVRSTFDLALRALHLPAGSEVLMSPITVADMWRIVVAHGLVPVPIDMMPNGQLSLESLEANLTSRSRILVAAHLFGGHLNLDSIAERLKRAGILLFEDSAQAFTSAGNQGHVHSDLVMISFGPIKTATAFGGAMVRVVDSGLRNRMQEILARDPIQASVKWQKRLLKFTLLKLVSGNGSAAAMHRIIRFSGRDCDRFINELGKGFNTQDIIGQIRYRPHPGLLKLMTHRWQSYDFSRIQRRKKLGAFMDGWLRQSHETDHAYWTYPLTVNDPLSLARRLRENGFDATSQSRLTIVHGASNVHPPRVATKLLQSLCFLPWYPELTDIAVERMAQLVSDWHA